MYVCTQSDPYHALVQYLTTVSNMKAETCGGVVGPSSNSVTELLAHRTTVVNNMDVMVSSHIVCLSLVLAWMFEKL